ncbi:MAG: MBL fold metallo-hydrolase [Candidatus Poribacteria bacterium]|nr:MBL fold metallo-hydrolase [Candidatus Poribacteria bacterium]
MKVRFWGVRGSIPTPGCETVRYGGETTCLEIRAGGELIIIDAGSGIRRLGVELLKEAKGQPIRAHLLMTHTHWDHIQGFPFFMPAFIPNNSFHLYGCGNANKKLEEILAGQMEYEYFPVSLGQMAATMEYTRISEEHFEIGDVQIQSMFMNHPGMALGYRIEHDGNVLVFTGDHEPYHHFLSMAEEAYKIDGQKISVADLEMDEFIERLDNKLVKFAAGADLFIFDTAYTYETYKAEKQGWGHSHPEYAVDIAVKAGVKRLALTHYDPLETDEDADAKVEHTRQLIRDLGAKIECFGAQMDLEVQIGEM